ncbi:MAG: hypothetical protein H7Z43_04220 [Clostridia bacterium]|nr:hypothetical protein [Deltaproteobacteria bacterium]
MRRSFRFISVILSVLLLPAIANACELSWPSLMVEDTLFQWWWFVIPSLLVFKLLGVQLATHGGWRKSALTALQASAISTLVGLLMLPVAGLAWEYVVGQYINSYARHGYPIVTWCFTFVAAVVISALVDAEVVRRRGVTYRHALGWLALADTLTVAVSFVCLAARFRII